jgi:hypothetical protein
MPATKTSEEVLEKYCRHLGKKFGDVYFLARNEWIDIRVTWNQYENLFGHGPERVDLMNKAGVLFFFMVQRHFFEAVLLAVCRLSDQIKTGRKANLTVLLFREFMDTDERRIKLDSLLEKVEVTTEFARDWRNRRISHNDLDLKNGTAAPLEEANRKLVSNAIKALHEVLNYINLEFINTELIDDVITGFNNEMAMLDRLYLGVMSYEKELAALKSGIVPPLERPEWLHNS